MVELDYSNKTVLVVGGSSGIGNGIAQGFRRQGATTHVWGTRSTAQAYEGEPGSDMTGLSYGCVDVSDDDAVADTPLAFDRLDVLVLSQGTVLYQRGEFEIAGFRRVLDVNLTSLMSCSMRFHAMLKASRGSLIIVSSTAAFHTTFGNPAYSASKTGAAGLTRTLAHAWAGDGIRVNGIAPGLVETKLTAVTANRPDRHASSLEKIPLGRWGTPRDMANAALFLASPMADYIIGHILPVEGGLLL